MSLNTIAEMTKCKFDDDMIDHGVFTYALYYPAQGCSTTSGAFVDDTLLVFHTNHRHCFPHPYLRMSYVAFALISFAMLTNGAVYLSLVYIALVTMLSMVVK